MRLKWEDGCSLEVEGGCAEPKGQGGMWGRGRIVGVKRVCAIFSV